MKQNDINLHRLILTWVRFFIFSKDLAKLSTPISVTLVDTINVINKAKANMIDEGVIDPLLVTKSALKNAASVATTILSTDCVINNIRVDESNR